MSTSTTEQLDRIEAARADWMDKLAARSAAWEAVEALMNDGAPWPYVAVLPEYDAAIAAAEAAIKNADAAFTRYEAAKGAR